MAERPGFMIYFDTAPAFERLDDADAGRLISEFFFPKAGRLPLWTLAC